MPVVRFPERRRAVSLALTVLLIFQVLALPLHEWALTRSGYRLTYHVPSWSAEGGRSCGSTDGRLVARKTPPLYNVATCPLHHLLHVLSSFDFYDPDSTVQGPKPSSFDKRFPDDITLAFDRLSFTIHRRAPPVIERA